MKKYFPPCLLAVLLISFVLSGCAENKEEDIVLNTVIKTETEKSEAENSSVYNITEEPEPVTYETSQVPSETNDFSDTSELTVNNFSETPTQTASDDRNSEPALTAENSAVTEAETSSDEAETVTAQNLLSSNGGSVIVENPILSEEVTEVGPVMTYSEKYHALNFSSQSGMWLSYLEYQRILKDHTEAEFTSEIEKAFDNMTKIGINTVYVQIRPFGDAYYFSDYFPAGDLMTKAYDPLEIMTNEAHERGLSIHGWINPLRIQDKNAMWALSERFPIKQWYSDKKKNMFLYEDRYYLDPSSEEARELICNGVREILENYKVDGIQIDDYFYPSADLSLDEKSYKASGTALSQEEFRLEAVSQMVKEICDTVHETNPTAVFGIAPMGYIDGNYETLFADVKKWCGEEGYCDYICPQIYFGFEHETRPFEETLTGWKNICRENLSVVIGIGAYRSGTENTTAGAGKNEWLENTDVISRQIKCAEKYGCGYALFRYDSLFAPEDSVKRYVDKEVENLKKN